MARPIQITAEEIIRAGAELQYLAECHTVERQLPATQEATDVVKGAGDRQIQR
jgi:hypothetical protein